MTATRKRLMRGLALVLIAGLLVAAGRAVAGAQAPADFAISWWVVAGGGGPATSGNTADNATVGQPIAGESAGGNITLGAGYWYGTQSSYTVCLPAVVDNAAGR